MIAVEGLTKQYGTRTVVDDLSFEVRPGRVTGFLGPNGAGKTQTIKMMLGLVRPTAGRALLDGKPIAEHAHPPSVVGTVLDGGAFHPKRTARNALRIHATVAGVSRERVDHMLGQVGLADAADEKVGKFSLGMRQRLALAQGLLPDAPLVIADEPVNGLDPTGIVWMRDVLRDQARQGKTVLVSSHLLSEMERLADDVLVIAQGRLLSEGSLDDLRRTAVAEVLVGAADPTALAERLRAEGLVVAPRDPGLLVVQGTDAARVGELALAAGVALYYLVQAQDSLEQRYVELTSGLGLGAS